MLDKARITAVVFASLLPGLAAPWGGAIASTPGGDSRVVSQQKEKPQGEQALPPRSAPVAKTGPMGVFSDIEKGWRQQDVDQILRHFGKSKVTISIDGTGPSGGQFSKNQSYYLLKDLFRYTITRKFEFVQYRKPNKKGMTTFAVAERYYQKTDDGRLFKDKIYVSLHLEDPSDESASGRWVVDEIKSIR